MQRYTLIAASLAAALLAGCDLLGGESVEKLAASREAEGKAVGGACRHAGRAIEDCYLLNKRVDKAAIFAGWRDMNDYMRENKIESVAPQIPVLLANAKAAEAKAMEPKPVDTDDAATAEKRAMAKNRLAATKPTGS